MRQLTTSGIVLLRTDFGEADRIITFITSSQGKIKVMAKGVRRAKAKLAGSVEPFGASDISFIVGRGEINTLTSARLTKNYGNIVKDLDKTNAGFEFMSVLNKATEDSAEENYYHLLDSSLAALNDSKISVELTSMWFKMQLLKLSGHTPNLNTDEAGKKLAESKAYEFNFDKMRFAAEPKGKFSANHIKFLRLGFGNNSPSALQRVQDVGKLINDSHRLIETILKTYIRI